MKVGGGGTEALGVEEVRLENLGEGEGGRGGGQFLALYIAVEITLLSQKHALAVQKPRNP